MFPVARGTHWFPFLALPFITEARNLGIEFPKLLCQQGLRCGLEAVRGMDFYKKNLENSRGVEAIRARQQRQRKHRCTEAGSSILFYFRSRWAQNFYASHVSWGYSLEVLKVCPSLLTSGQQPNISDPLDGCSIEHKGDVLGVQTLCTSGPLIIHITLLSVLNYSYLKYWVISVSPILP